MGKGIEAKVSHYREEEIRMKLLGVLLAVGGWLIAVSGVLLTSSTSGRLILCLVGIAVCLTGILKVLNGAYLKQAIWRQ